MSTCAPLTPTLFSRDEPRCTYTTYLGSLLPHAAAGVNLFGIYFVGADDTYRKATTKMPPTVYGVDLCFFAHGVATGADEIIIGLLHEAYLVRPTVRFTPLSQKIERRGVENGHSAPFPDLQDGASTYTQ